MSAQKKWVTTSPQSKPEKTNDRQVDNKSQAVIQKAEIEKMKQLLNEKIKDPKLAKKAAMIIAEMLNKKN